MIVPLNPRTYLPLILAPLLALTLTSCAPTQLAGKMLGRAKPQFQQTRQLAPLVKAVIKSTDAIRVETFTCGSDKTDLSVLIIEPRRFNFEISSQLETTADGEKKLGLTMGSRDKDLYHKTVNPKRLAKFKQTNDSKYIKRKEVKAFIALSAAEGGKRHFPKSHQPKTIVLLPGFGVPKEAYLTWGIILAQERGYRVIAPDLRGQNQSGGEGVRWGKHEIDDLRDLLSQLQQSEKIETKKVAVLGVSYGASMGLLWAAQDHRVSTVIAIAPYENPADALQRFTDTYQENIAIPIKPQTITRADQMVRDRLGITDWSSLAPEQALPKLWVPTLFVASDADTIMPTAVVKRLHRSTGGYSEFAEMKGIPHEYVGFNFDEMKPLILDWLDRFQ